MPAPDQRRRRCVLLVSSSDADRAAYEAAAATLGIDLTGDVSQPAIDGVLATDGPAALAAAAVAGRRDLSWHPRASVEASTSPLRARGRLMAAGLPVPWFFAMPTSATLAGVADRLRFPCVVKPVEGRGAIRADDPASFEAACERLRARLAGGPDAGLIVEAYVPGDEITLQGVLTHGAFHVLAVIAAGTSRPSDDVRMAAGMTAHAAAALGLRHGPLHAVCRVYGQEVFVLGLWPWPIQGPEASALRFATLGGADHPRYGITLSEILLRHALGESLDAYGREAD
jgi:hypothetical protein